jgi:hypothetical protein
MRALDQGPIRKLLTRLATKAQRAGEGVCRQNLDSKSFPEVFLADSGEDADYYWALLKEAAAAASVGITLKSTKTLSAEYERAPKLMLSPDNLPRLLAALGLAPDGPSYREEWKAALLSGLEAPPSVAEALSAFRIKVEGKSAHDIVQALNHLRQLRDEPLLLREVSSRVFWGLSKVLDDRGDFVAKLLDMPECPFPSSPLMLSIRLPDKPLSSVLFVENKTTFGILGRSDNSQVDGMALIYSAGYLASARRLTVRSNVDCYFDNENGANTGKSVRVQDFLFEKGNLPSYFFGDLDYAGMGIIKAMRQNFPSLEAWAPGYARLMARLQAGDGHRPSSARKAGQKDPLHTGCALADGVLLPTMRDVGLFVDQE